MDKQVTVGDLIALAAQYRDEKRELDKKSTELGAALEETKFEIMRRMNELGVEQLSGAGMTVTLSETVVATVEDWEALNAHILESGELFLLERRVSSKAYREKLAAEEAVPGTKPFTKYALNMRVK